MKPWFIAALCLATAIRLCVAETPPETGELSADAQFKAANETRIKGDNARDGGNTGEAALAYREAMTAYQKLANKYPDWQPGVMKFRITYCSNQLEALTKKTAGGTLPPPEAAEQRVPETPATPAAQMKNIKAGATQLLLKGETVKARELLMEGMRLDPDDITVRLLTGISQCQAGEFDGAVDLVKQVLVEAPSNACAHVVLGTILFSQGKTAEAEQELRRALESSPNLKAAHYDLARLLMMNVPPDVVQARSHYTKAIQLGATPDRSFESLLNEEPAPVAPPAPAQTPPVPAADPVNKPPAPAP